jgi:electron transport complex protein RnfD
VLAGRVVLQLLFPRVMLQQAWPILGPDRLLVGDPTRTAAPDPYFGWQESVLPPDVDAWLLPRTDALLGCMRRGVIDLDASNSAGLHIDSLSQLVNDVLPPWRDTVLGTVGGGIGETCVACVLLGGLFLIHRGLVRWQLPVSILVAAAITAAVFPITCGGGIESTPEQLWLPGLIHQGSAPVGLVYVLYQLTAGELVFAAFFVATDMVTSPLRARGQILFGLSIGVLAILLRMYGIVPGSCYWAILIMNPFVPLIDRITRSRTLASTWSNA